MRSEELTYTSRWVRANMATLYEEKKVKRQVGVRKVQKKKGMFSSEMIEVDEPIYEESIEKVPTGKSSETYIGIDDFAQRITAACNKLYEEGYDVIKVTEVIAGRYDHNWGKYHDSTNGSASTCYSYGYGYSVTDGVVILGKKREV